MDVDEAQSKLGKYGRYQMIYFFILSVVVYMPANWHMLAAFFHGIVPEHHCRIPEDATANGTVSLFDSSDSNARHCLVYSNISNVTQKCSETYNEWDYSGDVTETTVSQWNLVCDRAYLVKMSQSVLAIGIMTGAMLFSTLADMFGRKPIFLYCQWTLVIVGVINAYVTNHYVYLVLRFFTGILQQGINVVGSTLICEMFPAKQRTFAAIVSDIIWALCYCLLALLSYSIPNWTHLQMLISLSGVLTVPLYWFLPESVLWLCANDGVEEAERILFRAARINGIEYPRHVLTRPKEEFNDGDDDDDDDVTCTDSENIVSRYRRVQKLREVNENKNVLRYSLIDLIRHRILRLHAIVMGIIWFVINYVYYGLSLNTKDLAGNRYLNFFLSGLIEIPAYTFCFFVSRRWGRRLPLLGFQILTGVALIISVFISDTSEGTSSLVVLKTVCVMIGKFGITASFAIVYLCSQELFPTTLRSQGLGISSFCGRIGTIIAPFATALDVFAPWLSAIVFGTVAIGGGLLVLILPETLTRPLPQTIEEIENWKKTPAKKNDKANNKKPTNDTSNANISTSIKNQETELQFGQA